MAVTFHMLQQSHSNRRLEFWHRKREQQFLAAPDQCGRDPDSKENCDRLNESRDILSVAAAADSRSGIDHQLERVRNYITFKNVPHVTTEQGHEGPPLPPHETP